MGGLLLPLLDNSLHGESWDAPFFPSHLGETSLSLNNIVHGVSLGPTLDTKDGASWEGSLFS